MEVIIYCGEEHILSTTTHNDRPLPRVGEIIAITRLEERRKTYRVVGVEWIHRQVPGQINRAPVFDERIELFVEEQAPEKRS